MCKLWAHVISIAAELAVKLLSSDKFNMTILLDFRSSWSQFVDSITEQATKLGISTQSPCTSLSYSCKYLMFMLSHFQSSGQEQVIEVGPANIWPFFCFVLFWLYGSAGFYMKLQVTCQALIFKQMRRILPNLYSTWLVKWKYYWGVVLTSDLQSTL